MPSKLKDKENEMNVDDSRVRNRDDGSEEDGVDDDNNIHASPPPNKKKKKSSADHSPMNDRHMNPTGKPAEAGIIQEVYVENFMCHRKLSVKLCRNVNFINGQNGS